MKVFTIFYAPQYVAIEEMADFKWEDLRGKRFSAVRVAYIYQCKLWDDCDFV